MKKPEAILLIKESEFRKVIDYVMSVPTGMVPLARAAEVLNLLDNLTVVPAQAVPMLEQSLRQLSTPAPAPANGANGKSAPLEPSSNQDQA